MKGEISIKNGILIEIYYRKIVLHAIKFNYNEFSINNNFCYRSTERKKQNKYVLSIIYYHKMTLLKLRKVMEFATKI